MAEKCLIATTIAVLVCHPSSSIKLFRPKPNGKSPQRHKRKPKPLKSKEKQNPKVTTQGLLVSKLSKVVERDPLFSLVETIVRSSWLEKTRLKIKKVLRVSHSAQTLIMFEEYRKMVELKYSEYCDFNDENEIWQFHGAAISCSLGQKSRKGSLNACKEKRCGACRVLASNFSVEDGLVPFFDRSWEAHQKVMNQCLANGVSARKAFVMCRVIAGRTARCDQRGLMTDGEEGGFDSMIGSSSGNQSSGGEELFVLNTGAVLPCFVVIYSV